MSVSISSTQFWSDWPNAQDTAFDVRAKSNKSWVAADMSIVAAGESRVVGTGTVTALRATIPSITLPSTSAGLDNQTSKWTVTLHRTGVKNVLFTVLDDFPLDVSFEPATTWAAVSIAKHGKQPLRDTSTYTKTETQYQIQLALGTLNDASDVVKGRTRLSAAPVSANSPIAVGDNDPRVLSRFYNAAAPVYGIVGDGVANDTVAWRALLNAVPDGAVVFVPPTMQLLFNGIIALTERKSITITSFLDARNDSAFAPRLIWNGTGGTMFDLDSCQCIQIVGFKFHAATGKSIDKFINIDGEGGGQISSLNTIRLNTFNAATQSNASAKLVCISETAITNNENMNVSDNYFVVSSGLRGTAAGIGIFNGPNPNAKHQLFNNNGISQAAIGIKSLSGSFSVNNLGGGVNGVSIQILDATEPISITNYVCEGDLQAIDHRAAVPLTLTNCRWENTAQTNSGGFLKLTSRVTMTACEFYATPPVGGTLMASTATGVWSQTSIGTVYGVPVTMAQVGYNYFATTNKAVNVLDQLISIAETGISDAPSKYFFQYGGFDTINASPANYFFGNPIQLQGYTFAQLTSGVIPQAGQLAYITDSNTATWGANIAGGGANKVLAWFNNSNWTVAAK